MFLKTVIIVNAIRNCVYNKTPGGCARPQEVDIAASQQMRSAQRKRQNEKSFVVYDTTSCMRGERTFPMTDIFFLYYNCLGSALCVCRDMAEMFLQGRCRNGDLSESGI